MWFLKYRIRMCDNIWKICVTQWTHIFQMTNTCCYKMYHTRVKDPFEVKDTSMDFIGSFRFHIIIKKLPLIKFLCNVKAKYPQWSQKATKIVLLFLNHIFVRPDFLHVFQSKHHCIEWRSRYKHPVFYY